MEDLLYSYGVDVVFNGHVSDTCFDDKSSIFCCQINCINT